MENTTTRLTEENVRDVLSIFIYTNNLLSSFSVEETTNHVFPFTIFATSSLVCSKDDSVVPLQNTAFVTETLFLEKNLLDSFVLKRSADWHRESVEGPYCEGLNGCTVVESLCKERKEEDLTCVSGSEKRVERERGYKKNVQHFFRRVSKIDSNDKKETKRAFFPLMGRDKEGAQEREKDMSAVKSEINKKITSPDYQSIINDVKIDADKDSNDNISLEVSEDASLCNVSSDTFEKETEINDNKPASSSSNKNKTESTKGIQTTTNEKEAAATLNEKAVAPASKKEAATTLNEKPAAPASKKIATVSQNDKTFESLAADSSDEILLKELLNVLNYQHNLLRPYTSLSGVLVSVNPYKPAIETELEPFVESINLNENVTVLICGESGSGKTETFKRITKRLVSKNTLSKKLEAATWLFELLGNARTMQNSNSSRYGKQLKIYKTKNEIIGFRHDAFLLETWRVTSSDYCYHIFYSLLEHYEAKRKSKKTANEELSFVPENFNLKPAPAHYPYTVIIDSCSVLNIELELLEGILFAVLHLRRIKVENGQCSPSNSLNYVAGYLKKKKEEFEDDVLWRTVKVSGDVVRVPRTEKEANVYLSTLARATYQNLFKAIVSHVNSTSGMLSPTYISLLDLYGFENNDTLASLCINYANEKLHEEFTSCAIRTEYENYHSEGIYTSLDYSYPPDCINTIEARCGIIDLIEEECTLRGGTEALLHKLQTHCKLKTDASGFYVDHFAGTIRYNGMGLVEENTNLPSTAFGEAVKQESCSLCSGVCCTNTQNSEQTEKGEQQRLKLRKSHGLVAQFRESLDRLVREIRSTKTYFVRCIRPNAQSTRDFDNAYVSRQLNSLGLVALLRIKEHGVQRLSPEMILSIKKHFPSVEMVKGKTGLFCIQKKLRAIRMSIVCAWIVAKQSQIAAKRKIAALLLIQSAGRRTLDVKVAARRIFLNTLNGCRVFIEKMQATAVNHHNNTTINYNNTRLLLLKKKIVLLHQQIVHSITVRLCARLVLSKTRLQTRERSYRRIQEYAKGFQDRIKAQRLKESIERALLERRRDEAASILQSASRAIIVVDRLLKRKRRVTLTTALRTVYANLVISKRENSRNDEVESADECKEACCDLIEAQSRLSGENGESGVLVQEENNKESQSDCKNTSRDSRKDDSVSDAAFMDSDAAFMDSDIASIINDIVSTENDESKTCNTCESIQFINPRPDAEPSTAKSDAELSTAKNNSELSTAKNNSELSTSKSDAASSLTGNTREFVKPTGPPVENKAHYIYKAIVNKRLSTTFKELGLENVDTDETDNDFDIKDLATTEQLPFDLLKNDSFVEITHPSDITFEQHGYLTYVDYRYITTTRDNGSCSAFCAAMYDRCVSNLCNSMDAELRRELIRMCHYVPTFSTKITPLREILFNSTLLVFYCKLTQSFEHVPLLITSYVDEIMGVARTGELFAILFGMSNAANATKLALAFLNSGFTTSRLETLYLELYKAKSALIRRHVAKFSLIPQTSLFKKESASNLANFIMYYYRVVNFYGFGKKFIANEMITLANLIDVFSFNELLKKKITQKEAIALVANVERIVALFDTLGVHDAGMMLSYVRTAALLLVSNKEVSVCELLDRFSYLSPEQVYRLLTNYRYGENEKRCSTSVLKELSTLKGERLELVAVEDEPWMEEGCFCELYLPSKIEAPCLRRLVTAANRHG